MIINIVFILSIISLTVSGIQLIRILNNIHKELATLNNKLSHLKNRVLKQEKTFLEFVHREGHKWKEQGVCNASDNARLLLAFSKVKSHIEDFHIVETEHQQSELVEVLCEANKQAAEEFTNEIVERAKKSEEEKRDLK